MVKRRRKKASNAAKAKDNNKGKAVETSNPEETCSENANICVDDSPSTTKKPKLDSNYSPKQSKKYVPPFTTSQRVSTRLRNMTKNSEKSVSSSQEANVFKELEDEVNVVSNSQPKKENTPGKDEKGLSLMVSEAKNEKTDTASSNALVDTSTDQSDVKMKEDFKENDSKRIKENIGENISETSLKQSGAETQSVESSAMKLRDEKPQGTYDQCVDHDLQQVPKLAELAQRSCNQIEIDGKNKEERKSDECTKEMSTSKLETSTVVVGEHMSDETGLGTTELDRVVVGPEMSDAGAQISNIESEKSDFGARFGQVDARMEDVIDLHTLADTCAEEEYIDLVTVGKEPSTIFQVIQNQLHHDESTETKKLDKEKEDYKNDSHSLDIDKETIPYVILEQEQRQQQQQQQQQQQHTSADVFIQSNPGPFHQTIWVHPKIPLSDERDDKKAQNNEPTNRPGSLCSQEIIQEKLSEILAIISKEEGNEQRLSQPESESNPGQIAENADKCLDDPVKTSDTKIESKSDKYTPDGSQKNPVEERDLNSLVNNDTNSQNTSKIENIEIERCEEMQVDPAVNEKVKDFENKQVSDGVNGDKASSKGSLETGGSENLEKEKRMKRDKDVEKDDQEVPRKVATSPEQEVPQKRVTTAIIAHDESQKLKATESKVVASSDSFDDQSYTEEFRALEELLPTDDMGLFDDVLLSKPQSISVYNELSNGDGTIEFLINELNCLHCMVANFERTVEDIKRQYKSSGKF